LLVNSDTGAGPATTVVIEQATLRNGASATVPARFVLFAPDSTQITLPNSGTFTANRWPGTGVNLSSTLLQVETGGVISSADTYTLSVSAVVNGKRISVSRPLDTDATGAFR
jgi:hypothetical protein